MPGSFQMVYHGGRATTMGVDFTCVLFACVNQKSKAVLNQTLCQPTLIEKSVLHDKKQQSGMENVDAQVKFENLKATSIQGRISPTRSNGCPPPTARHTVVPGYAQGPHSGPMSKASRYACVGLSWSQKL